MKSEKSDARQDMLSAEAVAQDMHRFVKVAADARPWGDNVKARLARAARVLGITPRRAKALYYLEARVIPAHEYMACKQIAESIQGKASAVRERHAQASHIGVASTQLDRQSDRGTLRNDTSSIQTGSDSGPASAVSND